MGQTNLSTQRGGIAERTWEKWATIELSIKVLMILYVCVIMKLTVGVGAALCQWSQWAGMPSVAFYFQVT